MDCTVVIPVGPGHERLAEVALQSVMLAAQESRGAFAEIHISLFDDTDAQYGRSLGRNTAACVPDNPRVSVFSSGSNETDLDAVKNSEWLFFLDADDVMCSKTFHGQSPFATVEKYLDDYDAIWGDIYELSGDRILRRGQRGRMTSYKAYLKTPPYISVQMGHFLRRSAFEGFDVEMEICEDIKHYLYCWKELRCLKQQTPLFLNRRGAHTWIMAPEKCKSNGRDWSMEAARMLREARQLENS